MFTLDFLNGTAALLGSTLNVVDLMAHRHDLLWQSHLKDAQYDILCKQPDLWISVQEVAQLRPPSASCKTHNNGTFIPEVMQ